MEKIKVIVGDKSGQFEKGTPIGEIFKKFNIKGAIGALVKPLEEIKREEPKEDL